MMEESDSLSGYTIYSVISDVDVEEFRKLTNKHGLVELNDKLLTIATGGGCGLVHYIGQTTGGDELWKIVFRLLEGLSPQQIAKLLWKKDHTGARPIHWAAERNSVLLEQLLLPQVKDLYQYEYNEQLDDDSPIDCRDLKLETPLYYAALEGNAENVAILINGGADVNAKNESGHTALHIATLNRRLKIIGLLLDNRADTYIKDNTGKSAYETALEMEDEVVIAYFNPEARKRHEELQNLVNQNNELQIRVREEIAAKELIQAKLLETLQSMFTLDQKLTLQTTFGDKAMEECKRLQQVNEQLRQERQEISQQLVQAETNNRKNLEELLLVNDTIRDKDVLIADLQFKLDSALQFPPLKEQSIVDSHDTSTESRNYNSESDLYNNDSMTDTDSSRGGPMTVQGDAIPAAELVLVLRDCFSSLQHATETFQRASEITASAVSSAAKRFDSLLSN